ncbi:hypothetical protein [Amycolatopsis sp. NPDC051372]|uniref:hypothetical protein n=1 Tax=Amycolatopsis sp. NPDC051372 TaxID=3155669 RepID=UPI0034215EB8
MADQEFTPDQIEHGIACAVSERNFDVIPSLVKLLAIQDPSRAQKVLDALRGRVTLHLAITGEESDRDR